MKNPTDILLDELAQLCKETQNTSFVITYVLRRNEWKINFMNSRTLGALQGLDLSIVLKDTIKAIREKRQPTQVQTLYTI